MSEPLLHIHNLNVRYGAVHVLHSVSLTVNRGDIVTLIGANGAGKSTLLMSIFAQPAAFSGQITFAGDVITHSPTHRIAPRGIALVPEGRRLFPAMTVAENLLIGAGHCKPSVVQARRDDLYQRLPLLAERRKQRAGTLSGGEQQMLAIARALMSAPKLLLLDEPSLGLAPLMVKDIFALLKTIADSGTTLFLVEQHAYHALKLADRGYVLANGRIVLEGSGQDLLFNPEIQAAYLGGVDTEA